MLTYFFEFGSFYKGSKQKGMDTIIAYGLLFFIPIISCPELYVSLR